ncbi:hypothetical protein E3N88_19785 [Mikania micrantha]|uniref:Uncharacterized protein n=1 Tax=Mikania micrantha TaxID=192012 RepID=A0A5N6NQJ2_9ASTR|nr:hypothetical protein E3N88_19785 [Mikania micrantha]
MYSSTGQQQHVMGVPAQAMTAPSQWSTDLCDCGKDCSNCCLTCWCPCITFGRIAEVLDKGTTSCGVHGALYSVLYLFTGCQCIYSCMYRSKLRQQYMLSEEPCNDCLVHCCCECCALCQEYRELKYRGFEPSLGWEGNLARQNQGIVMPPVGAGEMKR